MRANRKSNKRKYNIVSDQEKERRILQSGNVSYGSDESGNAVKFTKSSNGGYEIKTVTPK